MSKPIGVKYVSAIFEDGELWLEVAEQGHASVRIKLATFEDGVVDDPMMDDLLKAAVGRYQRRMEERGAELLGISQICDNEEHHHECPMHVPSAVPAGKKGN